MGVSIFTHDRISLIAGLMANTGLLYGSNALQTINVTRNTPKNAQSAVGFLGIVDYTNGIVTSDVTLDTILTEGSVAAAATSTPNLWGNQTVNLATESYALTSFAMAMAAGSPATANYGYITAGMASYLKTKAQPTASAGTDFQMVLGDEGHGLILVADWGTTDGNTAPAWKSTIPTLAADGTLTSIGDYGLPASVQSLHLSASINRDHVLDLRSTRPCAFITTYPIDMSMDMEVYQLPGTIDATDTANPFVTTPQWSALTALTIQANSGGKVYSKAIGLVKQTEGDSVSVGRYLAYTVNFKCTDMWIPLGTPT